MMISMTAEEEGHQDGTDWIQEIAGSGPGASACAEAAQA